jgi:polyhydroxybutyrate depolymerase
MKLVWAILRGLAWSVLIVVLSGAALFGYFIYTPAPELPALTGELSEHAIEVDGRRRTYVTYVPRDLPPDAPLVLALHSSNGSSAQMRRATGYAFDRLADEHQFVVAYPEGFEGNWNACNIEGAYSANELDIDDVAFLSRVAATLTDQMAIDPNRVFATGLSRGGHMAFRLALEAPTRFRAVAAVAASIPAPNNFKCTPTGKDTPSVMIMNGTRDPLNPFGGGEVRLFGLFARGEVLSSRASSEYFAELNGITSAPTISETQHSDGIRVERQVWRGEGGAEIALVAIDGGGHVMPQPYWRNPRILGRTPREPNGPAEIWSFFERQADAR